VCRVFVAMGRGARWRRVSSAVVVVLLDSHNGISPLFRCFSLQHCHFVPLKLITQATDWTLLERGSSLFWACWANGL
jgi:hypothetical protein